MYRCDRKQSLAQNQAVKSLFPVAEVTNNELTVSLDKMRSIPLTRIRRRKLNIVNPLLSIFHLIEDVTDFMQSDNSNV